MMSKRAFLQTVTALLNSMADKRGFTCIKQLFWGFYLSQRPPRMMPSTETLMENIDVEVARAFLSQLLLT